MVDRASGRPLADAVVRVADVRLGAASDSLGLARMPALGAGTWALRTIAWGYRERLDTVVVRRGAADTTLLRMERAAGAPGAAGRPAGRSR